MNLQELIAEIADSGRARTPLSRLSFLRQVATEEELAQLFADLLVKAAEAKHANRWDDLIRFLEEWEDRTLSRLAAQGSFPEVGTIPWTPLRKPVNRARIALMTSGGLHLKDQEPFVLSNDSTYREIPRMTTQDDIRVAHRGYDISGPLEDMNCLLPLRRFEELESEEAVGSLAPTNYSFNGSVPDWTFLQEWPREAAKKMRQEDVDAILLTPA
jgi:D-proline reductase (dithiol) PrdB